MTDLVGEPSPEPTAGGEPGSSPAPDAETGEAKPAERKRRRRRKRKPKAEPGTSTGESAPTPRKAGPKRRAVEARPKHSAMSAVRALSEMAQNLLDVEGVDPLARPRYMDVQLRVPLDRRDAGKSAAAVVEQILHRVREVHDHEKALEILG